MSQETTIETRLSRLEAEVDQLKQQLAHQDGGSPLKSDWIEQIVGSMEEFPEFEQVLELGRAIRRADVPDDGPPPNGTP